MRTLDGFQPTTGIRDNWARGSVGDFLKEHLRGGSALSFVSAYFTLYAYGALRAELDAIEHLRFLFGEPRFIRSLDPERSASQSFRIDEDGLAVANRLEQKWVARECARWIEEKVSIRSVKQANLLHGKMYHIANGGSEEAIVGSSNFTVRGLGLAGGADNIELNLIVDSNRDRADLKAWFDALWGDDRLVQDVKPDVLLYLEQLYQDNPPEFVYFKTLFHLFERFLAAQARADLLGDARHLYDTRIWNTLFEFQKDGARGAINKILAHNGCVLADSVGLGKTYEALAVIKYFELMNGRVLVLCPKKLRENWTIYQAHVGSALNPFLADRFAYTVLSHTDLSRDAGRVGDIDLSTVNWGNFDLVVIDESHNFRNNARGRRDEDGNVKSISRYERLMERIIKAGIKTRVLLLSATPVNNTLSDLRNQIHFITEGRDDTFRESLGIASLSDTLNVAQREFNRWAGHRDERRTSDLLERLSAGFFALLDALTIARSRRHIQRYYQQSMAAIGGFPQRLKPIALSPEIDSAGRFLSYDRLNDDISDYRLSLFNPARYVRAEFRDRYDRRVKNFTQGLREQFLIGMMKVNFLKRLESSVHSFGITMERTVQKIQDLEQRIQTFRQRGDPDPNLNLWDPSDDEEDEDLRDAFVGKQLPYNLAHLNLDAWARDLRRDRDQLYTLALAARDVTPERDAKLARLKDLIAAKAERPTLTKDGRPNRKVLVFTAFADTAVYLYEQLHAWARETHGVHCALVTGSRENKTTFGKNDFHHILTNFAPLAKNRGKIASLPQAGEIDLLIATDCISEGQNLQDCDTLVNYDIHWNPVRIIQRFGRIDRIGSRAEAVQLVNFWPTNDLNKYINLKARVEARMALVDIAATLDDNLLEPQDIRDLITDELKYRDKQLLRLKDEVLDLEDLGETISLTEFTLDDFRMELARFLESNRRLLEDAPLGLYAVVPPDPAYPVVAPGVVFCLRRAGAGPEGEKVNPLHPYFLAYVRHDGGVRFTFAQPKQILELYRALCVGRAAPYEALCRLFDAETQNGTDMARYSDLLARAVASITGTFRRRSARQLLTDRGALLLPEREQPTDPTDFELITWLIIKQP